MASDDSGDPPEPTREVTAKEPRDREISESLRERLEALVPDLVRRTFSAGLGAVFSTEEGIRKITKELQLSNVTGYLADTADTTKDKVLEIIAREVREFLAHVNLSEEIAKLLTTLSFEIKTEIRFIPNSERYVGVDPDVKAAVRLKRNDKEVGKEAGKEAGKDKEPPREDERGDKDRDKDKDEAGRLRRLWRRATERGNGTGDLGEDAADDDPIDRDE